MIQFRSAARALIATPLLVGMVVAQPALAAHPGAHKTYIVKEMPGNAAAGFVFSPAKLTVHVGDTVKWVDANTVPHNVVGLNAAAKVINRVDINTKTYTLTFKKAGTYKYNCQIHPGMVGQIIVK